jgi:hypothetical protein
MSATNVGVGDTVKVDILVPDGGAGLFPRTILLNAANAAIVGSPLDLASVSGDHYSGTFTMPDTAKVTAITTIYTDSGHTIPSTVYEPVIDEFIRQANAVIDNAAIADAVWDEVLTGATHNINNSSGKRLRQLNSLTTVDSTINDAGATTTTFITNLTSSVNDFYKDQLIIFNSGALAGQSRPILSYNGTTKAITVSEPLTSAPANGVEFTLWATHIHPVGDIADAVWDEAKAGHVSAGSFGLELGTNQAEHDATQAAIAGIPAAPSAADIADQVWDESLAAHQTAGSTGEALGDAAAGGGGGGPSAADIADAVWDEAKSGHIVAGSFGLELNTNQAEHDATQAAISSLALSSNQSGFDLEGEVEDSGELEGELNDC